MTSAIGEQGIFIYILCSYIYKSKYEAEQGSEEAWLDCLVWFLGSFVDNKIRVGRSGPQDRRTKGNSP